MIEQTITFRDVVTDKEVTKKFAFHLTKAEIVRLIGKDKDGDWEAYVDRLKQSEDLDTILNFLEDAVRLAVGYRTPEGKFLKTKEFASEFLASEAWGELFEKMLLEDGFMEKFAKGLSGSHVTSGNAGLKSVAESGNRSQRRKRNRGK